MSDAQFQEQTVMAWRDWRRFLSLQLQLLDLRANLGVASSADAFEIQDSGVAQERTIKAQLAMIAPQLLGIFEHALAEKRAAMQTALEAEQRATSQGRSEIVAADVIDRAALAALLSDAEGKQTHGIGAVPLADGWYEVDQDQIDVLPDDARYKLRAPRKLGPGRIALGAAITLLGAAALWLALPQPEVAAQPSAAVLLDNQPVIPWQLQTLELTSAGATRTYAVVSTGAANPGDAAQWQKDLWPLTLCIPEQGAPLIEGATVRGDAATAARVYAPAVGAARDLIIRSCGGELLFAGMLTDTTLTPPLVLGVSATLPDGQSVAALAIMALGASSQPDLPPGLVQVVVRVKGDQAALSGRTTALRMPDGEDIQPSSVTSEGAQVLFHYLVPAFTAQLAAVQWRIGDPATGVVAIWQAALELPTTRADQLRQALADVQLEAQHRADGVLYIRLTMRAAQPLQLAEADLLLAQAGQARLIPPLDALRTPLKAGETRTIELALATPSGQLMTITIGDFAFEWTT
ncbi:MAG: hypothetical protein H7Z42_17495 [Roseiflexaceae bacterium]|nr:hypothetical protein [Roseiflexaceae bacterium]